MALDNLIGHAMTSRKDVEFLKTFYDSVDDIITEDNPDMKTGRRIHAVLCFQDNGKEMDSDGIASYILDPVTFGVNMTMDEIAKKGGASSLMMQIMHQQLPQFVDTCCKMAVRTIDRWESESAEEGKDEDTDDSYGTA